MGVDSDAASGSPGRCPAGEPAASVCLLDITPRDRLLFLGDASGVELCVRILLDVLSAADTAPLVVGPGLVGARSVLAGPTVMWMLGWGSFPWQCSS